MERSVVFETLSRFPEATALVVLIVGIVLAVTARRLTVRLMRDRAPMVERFVSVIGAFVFWALLALSAFAVLKLLGVGQLSEWLRSALDLLPQLVVAAAVVIGGHMLGVLAGDLTRRLAPQTMPQLSPRLAYVAVMSVAVITAIEQLGLHFQFVTELALIVTGTVLAASALAFALGARSHVANLIAAGELGSYSPGDRLRIDDTIGTVVEIRKTGVVLSTEEGLVSIPAAHFSDRRVTKLTEHAP